MGPKRYIFSGVKTFLGTLDDVLGIDFSAAILNEAFRSPDPKTLF